MSIDESLDVIFRHLPELKNRKEQREVVAINRKTGRGTRLHTPLGIFGQWKGGDVYYEVQPDTSIRIRLPRTVIDLFQTGETAEIGVRLRISIGREQIIPAAEA